MTGIDLETMVLLHGIFDAGKSVCPNIFALLQVASIVGGLYGILTSLAVKLRFFFRVMQEGLLQEIENHQH